MKKNSKKPVKKTVAKKKPAKKTGSQIVKAILKAQPPRIPKPPAPVVQTTKPAVKPPVVTKTTGAKPIVVPAKRIEQNGYTRPSAAWSNGKPKVTFRVWQIADEISAAKGTKAKAEGKKPQPATRKEVLAACAAEKISYSIFSNQFYRWRKFNGLFGRVKLDGTIAKVTGGPRNRGKRPPPKPLLATKPAFPVKPVAPAAKPTPAPVQVAPAAAKPPVKPALGKPALPFPVPAVSKASVPAKQG